MSFSNDNNTNPTGYPSIDKPWLKYYSKESIEAPLPEGTIYEYLIKRNRGHMNLTALRYFGNEISYKDFFGIIERAAAAFKAIGVKEGDVVTICSSDLPESIEAFYALNKIGAIACMTSPLDSTGDFEQEIKSVGSEYLVVMSVCCNKFRKSAEKVGIKKIIVISPADSLPGLMKTGYKLARKDPRINYTKDCMKWKTFLSLATEPAKTKGDAQTKSVIIFTGGTTGDPKGVITVNQCFNVMVDQLMDASVAGDAYSSGPGDTLWPIVPMFHNYGLCTGIHVPLCYGIAVLVNPQPDTKKVYEVVSKYKPNLIFGVLPFYDAMMNDPRFKNLKLDFFKYIVTGGDVVPEETERQFNLFLKKRGANVKLTKGYGLTEMTAVSTLTLPSCNEPDSVGVPMVTNNIKILDPETHEEKKYNEIGEICFASPTMMDSYYKNPKATEDVIWYDEDGTKWLHTGDMGLVTEDGLVYHKGRLKRIILTLGKEGFPNKIFPVHVENTLLKHRAVMGSAVVAMQHPVMKQAAKAYVILCDGFEASDKLTRELKKHCSQVLPTYSVPEEIEYVEDFPRTPVGKIDYKLLEEFTK